MAPKRLVQARAATASGASMAGTVAERATRAHEEASPLAAGRPQALNEDLSDCAEACPLARQPVFAVAMGRSRAPTGRGWRAKLPARTTTVGG